MRCECGSKKFVAQEQITDILDEDYNVLDSSYMETPEPCYTKIWCNECGKLIKEV